MHLQFDYLVRLLKMMLLLLLLLLLLEILKNAYTFHANSN